MTSETIKPAIELHGVSKRYWKIHDRSLLRAMIPLGRPNRSVLWALHDIDIQVASGETVGVIGRNGAGKSTLLRLLAGVSQPTSGTLTIRGTTVPLLSVGVGFHPEMTGRENVFVNAMLLGLNKSEITGLFDDIVSFAGVADFIDTPIKFYSAGMFMRLGFSVAIHVRPDILLVDEVLAVGDIGFQLRCLNAMRALQQAGTTIVFVSHSPQAVYLLCPRVIVLNGGRVNYDGTTESAIARYHELMATMDDGSAPVAVLSRQLSLPDGTSVDRVTQGQTLLYRTSVRFARPVDGPGVIFRIVGDDGTLAYSMRTPIGDRWRSYAAGEEASVQVAFRPRLGGGGTYKINVQITDGDSAVLINDQSGISFYVPPKFGVNGPADLEAAISIDGEPRDNHTWTRFSDEGPLAELPNS